VRVLQNDHSCCIKHSTNSSSSVIQKIGTKVFAAAGDRPVSYKLVSMVLACTGGGILVPLFINGIPVPLANDAYPIAILASFCIHHFFPIVGNVMKNAPAFKVS
jgi:uncharacterized membrane protein YeiH